MTRDELLAEWRAAYKELNPKNDETAMLYHDSTLALGVLLCRRMDRIAKTRLIEPAFAEGFEPQTTARPSAKRRRPDGR